MNREGHIVETVHDQGNKNSLQCMEIWGSNQAADTSVSTPGLDVWVYSQPHEQADSGGDVHYVSLCGGGVITRFLLADVSGHGASVGGMARSLRDLMRRNINRKTQDRLVQELNRQFTELAKLRRFATALVATYLTTGDKLTISSAGHPSPFYFSAATGEWTAIRFPKSQEIGLANIPLGIDDAVSFDQVELVLGRGDLVLFYSDALLEATSPEGRQLGESGLLDLLRFLDPHDQATSVRTLLSRLRDFRGGNPAEDDLTFLLLHHNAGKAPQLTFGQTLNVYAKVLGLKSI